ncbi:tetratricopeptide repeat protein [Methylophaga sp.]|uniref:tetratricopeptide repeat protein n=1 Tax=Methylophaga sp. TaxID=2024840 RepID=UPI00271D7E1D|nr:tetratricopeptide repeat protein [Methylophaga sp.]MDO8827408.1 tetratricopeptide repeat protein [Methylophaga sp.]
MDLLQQLRGYCKQFASSATWLMIPILLFGCAATAQQSDENNSFEAVELIDADTDDSAQSAMNLPLTPELVYYILTAEIAGQRGQLDIAVDLYNQAAELTDSPELAGRSARISTFSRDPQRINRALTRWQEVSPGEAEVYVMRVPFLLMEDNYPEVVKNMNRALALDPEHKERYLESLAANLSEKGDPERGLQTLLELDLYQQDDPDARYTYARLAAYFQRFEVAEIAVDGLLKEYPRNEAYLGLKADLLQTFNKSDEALKLIAKAAEQDGASETLRFTYGKLLGESGQSDKAKRIFEELHLENPDNPDVIFALGLLALEREDGSTAKTFFSQLLQMGDAGGQASYFMGLAEEMNDNIDSALVWFASVPADSQRFEMAQTRYINLLAKRGDVDKARQHLKLLRQERPQQAIDFYLFEAAFLRDQGMPEESFNVLSEALVNHPGNIDLLYSRAMVAESIDKLDVLESDLRTILKIDPNNSQALNALGYTLTDRTDRHDEALELINKALELRPNDPYYLDSLGWVYYRLGDMEKAEYYLREAVAIQADAEFVAHLGEVLWVQNKKNEAKKYWDQGLKLDPDNKVLQETLQRLTK